ncbi:uncharacterized protein LOC143909387 [Arctopsyche grandis]|uniref:uncharacterized protein LOC143909387 n=1 Tax=Arctopsyche grandis TaxID=121162 RepID=UPI00406D99EB
MALMLSRRLHCAFFTTYRQTQSKLIFQNATARFKYEIVQSSAMSTKNLSLSINNPDKFKKMQNKWRDRDGIPQRYELIYKTDLNLYFGLASVITTSFAAVSTLCLILGQVNEESFYQPFSEEKTMVIAESVYEIYFAAFGSIALMIGLKYLTRYVALRMYRYEKQYIVVYQGILPGLKRKLAFEAGEIELSNRHQMIPWEEANYRIGKQNCLLLLDHFRTPLELRKMLNEDPKMLEEEDFMKSIQNRKRR